MEDDLTKSICDRLDAEYVPEETGTEVTTVEETALVAPPVSKDAAQKKAEAEEDFQAGRKLLDRTVKSVEKALDNMDRLGEQIETAGFWESYAQVIGQAGTLAKDMMELHHKKDSLAAFIDEPEAPVQSGVNIENAIVYTGNLVDMQRQLKQQAVPDTVEVADIEETPEE